MTYYRTDLFEKAGIKMPDDADLRADPRFCRQDHRQGEPDLRHVPARQAGLGREHGLRHLTGECRGRAVVRHAVEADDRHARVAQGDQLLRRHPEGRRAAGRRPRTASTRTWRCSPAAIAACGSTPRSPAGCCTTRSNRTVADKVGFAPMPTGSFKGAPTWLWSWNLAIPAYVEAAGCGADIHNLGDVKQYIQLVAKENGWVSVPPGTRAVHL